MILYEKEVHNAYDITHEINNLKKRYLDEYHKKKEYEVIRIINFVYGADTPAAVKDLEWKVYGNFTPSKREEFYSKFLDKTLLTIEFEGLNYTIKRHY